MALFFYKWTTLFLLPFVTLGSVSKTSALAKAPHPFYVSVTEINQNSSAKTLEISCKFFTEDFEQAIEKAYKAQLDISLAKDKGSFDKFIPDYISKHLSLVVDGKQATLSYVGFEKEKESVYVYFEVSNISAVKNMSAVNSLLHDFINQQINIMHVTIGGKRQSTKLDYPQTKAAFGF
ncbi:MAG: hypothetical protein JWR72_3599 [Flavisolibacter sp.]|jgi:hypothetical protein|nr:hypothetical protein [Flavisolibacter sp.]